MNKKKAIQNMSSVNKLIKNSFNYTIKEECINQPLLNYDTSYSNILYHEDQILFTFDGRIFYFDKNFEKSYIFLPFPLKDGCFISFNMLNSKNIITYNEKFSKTTTYFILLDNQNKLQYTIYDHKTFMDFRITISRNVIQLVKYKNKVYFLSCKNNMYYINLIIEDGGILKPQLLISNITSNFGIKFYMANKKIFIYRENELVTSSGEKLCFIGEAIYELNDCFVIYNRFSHGLQFILCNIDFDKLNEIIIPSANQNITIETSSKFLMVRTGTLIYVIGMYKKNLKVFKTLKTSKNILKFLTIIKNKELKIIKLYKKKQNEILDVTRKFDCISDSEDFKLPVPELNSVIYNPIKVGLLNNLHHINITQNLNSQFKTLNLKNENNLQDKIFNLNNKSSELNIVFNFKILEKGIKDFFSTIEQDLSSFFEHDNIKKNSNEKFMNLSKFIICDNLLLPIQIFFNELCLYLKTNSFLLVTSLNCKYFKDKKILINEKQEKKIFLSNQFNNLTLLKKMSSIELLKLLESFIDNIRDINIIIDILHHINFDSLEKNYLIKFKILLEKLCKIKSNKNDDIYQLKFLASFIIYKISKKIT